MATELAFIRSGFLRDAGISGPQGAIAMVRTGALRDAALGAFSGNVAMIRISVLRTDAIAPPLDRGSGAGVLREDPVRNSRAIRGQHIAS